MKNSLKLLFLILAVTVVAIACKKNSHSSDADNALTTYQPPSIRVNQAITVYDSTALSDSPRYFQPPTNRFYRWTITPADQAAVLSGSYQYGKADIIFNHSGIYEVKADIYDSLDQHLLGHTNQVAVSVSADTLFPSEPLQPGDQLTGTALQWFREHDTAILAINFTTTRSYLNYGDATVLQYNTSYTNALNIDFSDSAYLSTYPFAYASPRQAPVTGGFEYGFIGPDSEQLNINWQGNTYSGNITVDANGLLSLTWNTPGPVQINFTPW